MAVELNIKTKVDISDAKKGTDDVKKGAKSAGGAIDQMTGALDKFTGGAITAFKSFKAGAVSGIASMKTLKGAIASTGIGLLVIAVGSLVTYFTKSQEGADKLDKAFAVIGATVDVLIDRISTFGSGLFEIMSGNFSAGLDILAGSFKGITEEIEKEATAAYELEGANQQLIKTKRAFIEQEAKLNADLEKYRLASENFDLSTAERLKANEMAQKTAIKLADQRAAIAREELRILTEKNSLGNSLNDDLEAEAEAKAKLFEIEGQRDALAKEFQAKAKSITDEQKSASAARAAEIKAENEKKAAEDLVAAKEQADRIEAARIEAIRQKDNELREYKLENDEATLEDLLIFEQRKRDLELEQTNLTEGEKEAIRLSYLEKEAAANKQASDASAKSEKERVDKELADAEALKNAKTAFAFQASNLVAAIAGKDSKIAKGVAVGQATISGIQSVQNAYMTASASPLNAIIPGYPAIQAGIAGAFSALQLKKILSTNPSKGGGSPSVATGGGTSAAQQQALPSFDFVNQGVGGTENAGFRNKAYVVSQDIKDTAALDARINDLARA